MKLLRSRHVIRSCGWLALVTSVAALQGCKDLAGSAEVQSGTLDPKVYNTPGGVQQQLEGIRTLFGLALNEAILGSGTLSDELSDGSALDKRQLPQSTDPNNAADPALAYARLQDVRVQADITARMINAHKIDVPPVVRGELYALQGYAEILLADLYCSGIPLTTLSISNAILYQPGMRSDSVYAHAVRLFDSASALSSASSRVMTLARVGKGRALLALGQYDAAAQAVASVATTDEYGQNIILGVPPARDGLVLPTDFGSYSVSDREGVNGIPYRSSDDPRTRTVPFTDLAGKNTYYAPQKYQTASIADSVKIVVAGGIEARLIEVEAALRAGQTGPWLATLNALRTHGQKIDTVFDIQYRLDGSGNLIFDPTIGYLQDTTIVSVDTTWSIGDGGVTGLLPIADPGSDRSRVDTLFAERAKWLFLTAHRQGDLRRLLRQYPGRIESQVYPSGRGADGDSYGNDVTAPIPANERVNPYFDGCFDRLP